MTERAGSLYPRSPSLVCMRKTGYVPGRPSGSTALLLDCQPLLQERCDFDTCFKYNNIEFTHVKLLLVLSDKCIVEHCFLCSLSPMGGENKGSQLHRDELCYIGG